MTKILVTGASGRLGSLLTRKLLDQGNEVTAITSNPSLHSEARLTSIQVDWSNFNLPTLGEMDCVIHLAHQTSAYLARKNVVADVRENLLVTTQLVNHLKNRGSIPKFIYLGSLTEFGRGALNPIQDTAQVKPETFYDAAKIATETYLEQFHNEGWIQQLVILRLGNLYGLNSENLKNHRGFLDKSIGLAAQGFPLRCFGTGNYLRDFIHIDDALEILVKAAVEENREKSERLQLNVATGIGTSIIDALKIINYSLVELGRPSVEIQFSNFPPDSYPIETRSHFADISGASRRFNWVPRVALHEGVQASLRACLAANQ